MRTIEQALKLFIENIDLISRIVLTVWLPGSILLVCLRTFIFPETVNGGELETLAWEMRVINLIEVAVSPIYVGALIYALSQIKMGIQPSYQESMQYGIQKCYKLFLARFSSGLIIVLGLIAFIIPGIIFCLQFAFLDMIVVLDDKHGSEARQLSRELTKGRKGRIFITLTVTVIGITIFNALLINVLSFPSSLIGWQSNLVVDIFSECISNVTCTLINIVLFLFYWNAKKNSTTFTTI